MKAVGAEIRVANCARPSRELLASRRAAWSVVRGLSVRLVLEIDGREPHQVFGLCESAVDDVEIVVGMLEFGQVMRDVRGKRRARRCGGGSVRGRDG